MSNLETVPIEYILFGASALLLLSIASSKVSGRLGVPALLMFLVVGILAGSEGPGGIYFDDAWATQFLGVLALVFILFTGGLGTHWASVKPVLGMGLALATVGVLVSALLVALFSTLVLGLSPLEGLLLGTIISSTDAAAVFSVLRSKGIHLKNGLAPLVEMESGSNDPMAVFLTVGLTELIAHNPTSTGDPGALAGELLTLVPEFFIEMVVGSLVGYLLGRGMVLLINRIRLDQEGLYPVLSMSLMLLVYGGAASLHGNGFLAVYIAGLVLGNNDFVHKRSLMRFHDGIAWLMQIAMFLTLGLLVFPSRVAPVIGAGVVIAIFLMLVARPASVFVSLAFSKLGWREKAFVGWAGLRGAVPIILATFPLLAGVPRASAFFNLIFFIVLFSVLLQGTTLGQAARWLRVEESPPGPGTFHYPMEFVPEVGAGSRLVEITIPRGSRAGGKSIMELGLPRGALVVLVDQHGDNVVPTGATIVEEGSKLLVLADEGATSDVLARVGLTPAEV
ncbi:MAG TPA: potassium/proton antiporter [Chloroflexia bacterium]|nr:potassium/proton antiporter [Chloroflexia bacterium]